MAAAKQVNIALTEDEGATFDAIAQRAGVTSVELGRRCLKAMIAYAGDGRTPTFPIMVTSPGYRVIDGRVVDASAYSAADPIPLSVADDAPATPPPAAKYLGAVSGAAMKREAQQKAERSIPAKRK